jgi:GntP family gluconate:H+ symporter
MAIMGVTKITMGVITLISVFSTTVSESIASGALAGFMKFCSVISGGYALLIVLVAVALAAMIVTAVGVFVDIAVLTVAPVALAVGRRAGLPVPALLLAMVGGGKAGNVISPNPNTIAAADAFKVDLTALMVQNAIPALCALVVTVALSAWLAKRGENGKSQGTDASLCDSRTENLPGMFAAVAGPCVVVALLALRPMFGIAVDPLVALPAGGFVSIILCGHWRKTAEYCEFGLSKVSGVAILLVGTGAVAGIVKNSGLNADMISLLDACHLPAFALAPLSSVLLSGATASTTAGVTIASQTFSATLVEAGVPALSAAAMLHAGGTIFDALPHGSFFHATAGAVGMGVKDRLKLFPYGTLVGATTTVVSVIVYLI